MNGKTSKTIMAVLVALIVIVGGLRVGYGLQFDEITTDKVMSILVPLFLIALFIERALEVYSLAWRKEEAEKLAAKYRRIQKIEVASKPSERADSNIQKIGEESDQLFLAHKELLEHKSSTRKRVLLSGVVMGVLAGALGVRAVEPLVLPDSLDNMGSVHRFLFSAYDIAITGALLGGGSDGVHKILNTVLTFFTTTKERLEARQ